MSIPAQKYSETLKVHSYEVDSTNHATLAAICQYFQEVASNHAEILGFGRSLLEQQRTWMLSRLLVNITRVPLVGENITVYTWPSGIDRLLFLRDFEIFSEKGELLVSGVSSWAYMNLDSRRLIPPSSWEFDFAFTETQERALSENPGKVTQFTLEEKSCSFKVRYNDLDMNKHVNNIKYIEWIMESLQPEFRETHLPLELSMNFLAEAFYNHEVSMYVVQDGQSIMHCVQNGEGQDICRARTSWKPLS